jgi:hypothetical protein
MSFAEAEVQTDFQAPNLDTAWPHDLLGINYAIINKLTVVDEIRSGGGYWQRWVTTSADTYVHLAVSSIRTEQVQCEFQFFNDHIRYIRYFEQLETRAFDDMLLEVYGGRAHITPYLTHAMRQFETVASNTWKSMTTAHRISLMHPNSPWAILQDPFMTAETSSTLYLSPEEEARNRMRIMQGFVTESNADNYTSSTQDASVQASTTPF